MMKMMEMRKKRDDEDDNNLIHKHIIELLATSMAVSLHLTSKCINGNVSLSV